MESVQAVLRVERGAAGEEELAALAAVLLALRARGGGLADEESAAGPRLGWHWWRRPGGYAPPGSWR
ncbi:MULTISPECIES: acyl-CoA carboxylase epsilon subunit [unclassified Streptomyces]|uniref:acyl-CoA carboxylase epsilon subunit n=1 Tax=unclassified Streptomyces TaxID=2593676 RepID=UPI003667A3CE